MTLRRNRSLSAAGRAPPLPTREGRRVAGPRSGGWSQALELSQGLSRRAHWVQTPVFVEVAERRNQRGEGDSSVRKDGRQELNSKHSGPQTLWSWGDADIPCKTHADTAHKRTRFPVFDSRLRNSPSTGFSPNSREPNPILPGGLVGGFTVCVSSSSLLRL